MAPCTDFKFCERFAVIPVAVFASVAVVAFAHTASAKSPGEADPTPREYAPIPTAASTPDLRGTIEDTLNLEYRRDSKRVFPTNILRTRLTLDGKPGPHVDFGVSVVGTLVSGATALKVAPYLPSAVQAELAQPDPSTGAPGAAALLAYELTNRLYLQEAFVTVELPLLRLRVGRQKYYSGTGFAYNPTDLLNSKDPLDPTYEIDGIDAILAMVELPRQSELHALIRFGESFESSDYLLRLKSQMGHWDVGVQYTDAHRKRVDWALLTSNDALPLLAQGVPLSAFERAFRWQLIAAEFSGEVFEIGIRAEGGYAFVTAPDNVGTLRNASKDHERFLVSLDHTFDFQLYLMVEYVRLGQGRTGPEDITLNDRLAQFAGEILGTNRDTVFAGLSYPLSDFTEFSLYGVINANDPSGLINPWLVIDLYSGIKLAVAGYMPVGTRRGQNGRLGSGGFARLKLHF